MAVSLIFSHFAHEKRFDMQINGDLLKAIKDFGQILFFAGAGVDSGKNIMWIIERYGVILLLYAVVIVLIPLFLGFFFTFKIIKFPLLNSLAIISGSMTCTPSLTTLVTVAGTDDVAGVYACVYPVSIILMIFAVQFLAYF